MSLLAKVIKDCTTSKDGESFEAGRILWIFGALAFLALSCYHVWRNHAFDPLSFGTGYGGLIFGGGAGIGLKSNDEPHPPEDGPK